MTLPPPQQTAVADALASAADAPAAAAAGAAETAARAATDAAKKRAAKGAPSYDAWRALVDTAHLKALGPAREAGGAEGRRGRPAGRGRPPLLAPTKTPPPPAGPAPPPSLTLGADGVPRRW